MDGFDYLLWQPDYKLSDVSTEIIIRFKATASHGILLYAVEATQEEYILLELYDRSLFVYYKTAGSVPHTTKTEFFH